jgi:tetratricopeptide (TPR) repeat protein
MKKLLFILFFIVGCNSNSKQIIPVVENELAIVNSNFNNELYDIDKEIINNPKSPNVYLKRALYHQNKRNFNSALEDINRALSITPDLSFLKYHKASILYELAVFNQDISLIDESKIYLDNCIRRYK